MFIIKWTNKYSNEEGYVKVINRKDGYFENTYEKENAFHFKTKGNATKAMNWLTNSNEGENNIFSLEEVSN